MPLPKISRRTVLRGAGGIAVALPPLEAMMNVKGTAYADNKPFTRYVVCYGGCSIGASYDKSPPLFAPDKAGPDYDLKAGLKPLEPIKNLVSVVSGLRIPCAAGVEESDASKIAPGGKPGRHHNYGIFPLLSGVRSVYPVNDFRGPTSDLVIAEGMPRGSTPYQSLQYAIQASNYYHLDASITNISVGSDRNPLPAQDKPSQAWRKLFLNFTPPPADGQEAAKQFEILRAQRKTVVDAVVAEGRVKRLLSRVSATDRGTIELHLQRVRDLQDQISKATVPNTAACQKVAGPPQDPPIGRQWKINPEDQGFVVDETGNYSNEEQRAKLFMQFAQFALGCNQTRVLSIKFTEFQSYMNMYPLIGDKIGRVSDLHGCGHGDGGFGKQSEAAAAIAWHLGHFANLVAGLRDTREGSGSVLDNTVLVFVFDSGYGVPEEADNQANGAGPHCSYGMGALVAGGKNLGLKPGWHVPFNNDRHPAQVLLSAMHAVDGKTQQLGEVSGVIPELFNA